MVYIQIHSYEILQKKHVILSIKKSQIITTKHFKKLMNEKKYILKNY